MELRRGNIECSKDIHREVIKGKGDIKVQKKERINIEKRTIRERSIHTDGISQTIIIYGQDAIKSIRI